MRPPGSSSLFAPADFPDFSTIYNKDKFEIPEKLIFYARYPPHGFSGTQSAPQHTHTRTHTKAGGRAGVWRRGGTGGGECVVCALRVGGGDRLVHIYTLLLSFPC